MTGETFYKLLYDWCVAVLGPSVPVIRANQNAAKPAGTYIVIEDDVAWAPVGREDRFVDATTSGQRLEYAVTAAFWEVSNGSGFGDNLRKLRESLRLTDVRERFSTAHVGVLVATDVLSLPWTSPDTQIIREKRFEVHFSVANFVNDVGGTPGAIASVQTVNDLKVVA